MPRSKTSMVKTPSNDFFEGVSSKTRTSLNIGIFMFILKLLIEAKSNGCCKNKVSGDTENYFQD